MNHSLLGISLALPSSVAASPSKELFSDAGLSHGHRARMSIKCHAESTGVLVSSSESFSHASAAKYTSRFRESSSTGFLNNEDLSLSALDNLRLAASKVTANQAAAAHATALARAALRAAKEAQAYASASRQENRRNSTPNLTSDFTMADVYNRSAFSMSQFEQCPPSTTTGLMDAPEEQGTGSPNLSITQKNEVQQLAAPLAFRRAMSRAKAKKEQQASTFTSVKGRGLPRKQRKKAVKEDSDLQLLEALLQKIQLEELDNESDSLMTNFRHEQITNLELRRGKLLASDEEVLLTKGVQQLLKLEKARVALTVTLNREPSQVELAKAMGYSVMELTKWLAVGQSSKQVMVRHNIRLVYSVAKNYMQKGIRIDDLVTEGCRGLIRGLEKFDHTKGFKFSTYAHWWIRQAVTRSASEQARTIRMPAHMYELVSRIFKAREMIQEECKRPARPDEIAQLVGISMSKLTTTMEALRKPKLMSSKVYRDSQETIGEFLADPEAEGVEEEEMTQSMLKRDLESVLHTLNPRERDVMMLRYGLDDGRPKTLEEVGFLFQVTRERIRQIETKALRKLKQTGRNNTLKEYVGADSHTPVSE